MAIKDNSTLAAIVLGIIGFFSNIGLIVEGNANWGSLPWDAFPDLIWHLIFVVFIFGWIVVVVGTIMTIISLIHYCKLKQRILGQILCLIGFTGFIIPDGKVWFLLPIFLIVGVVQMTKEHRKMLHNEIRSGDK